MAIARVENCEEIRVRPVSFFLSGFCSGSGPAVKDRTNRNLQKQHLLGPNYFYSTLLYTSTTSSDYLFIYEKKGFSKVGLLHPPLLLEAPLSPPFPSSCKGCFSFGQCWACRTLTGFSQGLRSGFFFFIFNCIGTHMRPTFVKKPCTQGFILYFQPLGDIFTSAF